MQKLKEMGANAMRLCRNAMAPELFDACDRLGILVMAENSSLGRFAGSIRRTCKARAA